MKKFIEFNTLVQKNIYISVNILYRPFFLDKEDK
jgi:hypothetical protein